MQKKNQTKKKQIKQQPKTKKKQQKYLAVESLIETWTDWSQLIRPYAQTHGDNMNTSNILTWLMNAYSQLTTP